MLLKDRDGVYPIAGGRCIRARKFGLAIKIVCRMRRPYRSLHSIGR